MKIKKFESAETRVQSRSGWPYYLALTLLSLAYIGITLFSPIVRNDYGMSFMAYKAMQLSVILPVVLIWYMALFGSLGFKKYSDRIKSNEDGVALDKVSTGLLVLVAVLVLSSVVQSLRPLAFGTEYLQYITMVSNHIGSLGSLLGFWFIFKGSSALAKIVGYKDVTRLRNYLWLLVLPIIVLYVFLFFQAPELAADDQ